MSYTPIYEYPRPCPGGCDTIAEPRHLCCRPCWRRLPQDFRTHVITSRWAASGDPEGPYAEAKTQRHHQAVRAAVQWLVFHPQSHKGGFRVW